VDVSRDGGFLQRSVLGGAARLNEPMNSGSSASLGQFKAVKQDVSGGIVLYVEKRATGNSAVPERSDGGAARAVFARRLQPPSAVYV
jgi:hypothetical protein